MTGKRFFRYELRTTDVGAAREFYSEILGAQFACPDFSVVPLPERAVARGAPAHWLGHIGTSDVEGAVARMVEMGGQQLGPTERVADGSSRATLRDPFGAVVAVSSEDVLAPQTPVVWHVHHSEDHKRSFALYREMFGWTAAEELDLGPQIGCHQIFSWDPTGRTTGSMANTARLPHIHPQWLFFFRVSDIEDSLAKVRSGGGISLEPMRTSTGDIVAPCDDPQGAAFALYQFAG